MQTLDEDVPEQLAPISSALTVLRAMLRELVCPRCRTITRLSIERSIAHHGLLADILVWKYADHQPL